MQRKRDVKSGKHGRDLVDELGLNRELVGVPHAVEKTFPELLHVIIGDLRLIRKPVLEKRGESFVAGGLVA